MVERIDPSFELQRTPKHQFGSWASRVALAATTTVAMIAGNTADAAKPNQASWYTASTHELNILENHIFDLARKGDHRIQVLSLSHSKSSKNGPKEFILSVENAGQTGVYNRAEVVDMVVNGKPEPNPTQIELVYGAHTKKLPANRRDKNVQAYEILSATGAGSLNLAEQNAYEASASVTPIVASTKNPTDAESMDTRFSDFVSEMKVMLEEDAPLAQQLIA